MYVHYMRLDLFLISNYVLYITAIKQKTISLALILSKMGKKTAGRHRPRVSEWADDLATGMPEKNAMQKNL